MRLQNKGVATCQQLAKVKILTVPSTDSILVRTFQDAMREMTALSARLNVARQVLKIFFLPEDTQLGFDKKKNNN